MIGFLNRSILFFLLLGGTALATPASPHDLGALGTDNAVNADDVPGSSGEDAVAPVISVAPVEKPSISGYGTLDESNGGLPAAIWKGSSRESAGGLLQYIHSGIANDAIRTLATRLLMTQATAPEGSGDDWFVMRVNALVALGEDDKAEQMIASLPVSMMNDALRQTHAELTLIRGDTNAACQYGVTVAGSRAPTDTGSPFWQKLNILCKAQAGKQDEAMVGIDVLREEGQLGDMFFPEEIRKLGDKNAAVKSSPKKWTLLDVALVRLTGDTERLKDRLDALPPVAVKYLAQDSAIDVKLREKASLKAEQLGILPAKEANKTPEQPFAKSLASDVATLVRALGSGKPVNDSDNEVIARLALDDGVLAIQDSRRIERLLTLMTPFGYKVLPEVWQKLFLQKHRFDGDIAPAILIANLNDASQAGRKGEVILLSALIMAGDDTDRISELALLPILKSLKVAGFDKEARSVAYSAVKSYSER